VKEIRTVKKAGKMKLLENKKFLLTLIFVAALLVRLGTMVALETYKFASHDEFGTGFGKTARHIALGEGFSEGYYDSGEPRATAVSPPVYVYFVGFVFSIFGIYSVKSAIVIELFQSLCAALSCLVFYQLGKKFSEATGLLAAAGMAFYPPSILFSTMRIGPIVLVVLLIGMIILYLFKIQEHWHRRDAVICGVLMGVTALVEPAGILFFVASCLWLFLWSSGRRLEAVKSSAIMGTVCILCIVPWTIRNYVVFHAFVPLKSSMGTNLLQGNNPYANGLTFDDFFRSQEKQLFSEQEREKMRNLDEVQRNKIMQEKAIGFIKADPERFVELTLKRIFYYWNFVNPYRPTPYDTLRIITYGPVFILAMIGLIMSHRRWREGSLFLALIVSYPVLYYVTQVTINRYRYGVEAFLLVLASYATVELVNGFRRGYSFMPAAEGQPSRRADDRIY
jgi:dolichyl-phosphate-mannose-protein mannosyltransferase